MQAPRQTCGMRVGCCMQRKISGVGTECPENFLPDHNFTKRCVSVRTDRNFTERCVSSNQRTRFSCAQLGGAAAELERATRSWAGAGGDLPGRTDGVHAPEIRRTRLLRVGIVLCTWCSRCRCRLQTQLTCVLVCLLGCRGAAMRGRSRLRSR